MKKASFIIFGLLAAGYLLIILFIAGGVTRKTNHEVQRIHTASKEAIGSYLGGTSPRYFQFPSNPVYVDKNECILIGIVPGGNSPGKQRMKFIVFLERRNQVWRAQIIKATQIPFIPPPTKKAPWDYFRRSANHKP